MGFFIGLLTVILVLDCIALIFLVLIQLPKKEAGLGLAFGGSAADALFGAGSGTVLTKATKYAATIFFVLAVILGMLQTRVYRRSTLTLEKALQKQTSPLPGMIATQAVTAPVTMPTVTTNLAPPVTSAPSTPATAAPPPASAPPSTPPPAPQ